MSTGKNIKTLEEYKFTSGFLWVNGNKFSLRIDWKNASEWESWVENPITIRLYKGDSVHPTVMRNITRFQTYLNKYRLHATLLEFHDSVEILLQPMNTMHKKGDCIVQNEKKNEEKTPCEDPANIHFRKICKTNESENFFKRKKGQIHHPSVLLSSEDSILLMRSNASKKTVWCYTCGSRVREPDCRNHIYFGALQCIKCKLIFTDCCKYADRSFNVKVLSNNDTCSHHKVMWYTNPFDFLVKHFVLFNENKVLSTLEMKEKLEEYLSSSKVFSKFQPYKEAYEHCSACLQSNDMIALSLLCDNTKSSIGNSNQCGKSEMLTLNVSDENCYLESSGSNLINKHEQKNTFLNRTYSTKSSSVHENATLHNTKSDSDIIQVPKHSNYLVCDKIIEECPICYSRFLLTDFVFDFSTCLVKVICSSCKLHIYFVLKPPKGYESEVFIKYSS